MSQQYQSIEKLLLYVAACSDFYFLCLNNMKILYIVCPKNALLWTIRFEYSEIKILLRQSKLWWYTTPAGNNIDIYRRFSSFFAAGGNCTLRSSFGRLFIVFCANCCLLCFECDNANQCAPTSEVICFCICFANSTCTTTGGDFHSARLN